MLWMLLEAAFGIGVVLLADRIRRSLHRSASRRRNLRLGRAQDAPDLKAPIDDYQERAR